MTANALNDVRTFEAWAKDYYEPQALRHYDRAISRMLRLLKPEPDAEILDAGCGTGVHSIRIARAGYRVRGIDISPVALNKARQIAQQANAADRVQFVQGDLTQLPFRDSEFAAIYSWGVVIHIHPMEPALRELVRVLRPGGRIALQVTNGGALDQAIESIARRITGKPRKNMEHTPLGTGAWDESDGGRLWTVHTNIAALTNCMEGLGCRRLHRTASEFTELQRRTRGLLRIALRRLNSIWFAMRLPAGPACTNLLVFKKRT